MKTKEIRMITRVIKPTGSIMTPTHVITIMEGHPETKCELITKMPLIHKVLPWLRSEMSQDKEITKTVKRAEQCTLKKLRAMGYGKIHKNGPKGIIRDWKEIKKR